MALLSEPALTILGKEVLDVASMETQEAERRAKYAASALRRNKEPEAVKELLVAVQSLVRAVQKVERAQDSGS